MATAQLIIARVRDSLNDTDHTSYRWEDDYLLRRLNEGLEDLAVEALAFKTDAVLQLKPGQAFYKLPEDAIQLKTVLYQGKELPIVSSHYLNNIDPSWRTKTTDHAITHIVFDQAKRGHFRVFPSPSLSFKTSTPGDLYGVIDASDVPPAPNGNSTYGVVDGQGVQCQIFGTVTSVTDTLTCSDRHDIVFPIYYNTPAPAAIDKLGEELELSAVYNAALTHYIVGITLRNDLTAGNRALGNEELRLYEAKKQTVASKAQMEQTSASHFNSVYHGMG